MKQWTELELPELRPKELFVLKTLYQTDSLGRAELLNETHLPPGTVDSALTELVDKELIRKAPSVVDPRGNSYEATILPQVYLINPAYLSKGHRQKAHSKASCPRLKGAKSTRNYSGQDDFIISISKAESTKQGYDLCSHCNEKVEVNLGKPSELERILQERDVSAD